MATTTTGLVMYDHINKSFLSEKKTNKQKNSEPLRKGTNKSCLECSLNASVEMCDQKSTVAFKNIFKSKRKKKNSYHG